MECRNWSSDFFSFQLKSIGLSSTFNELATNAWFCKSCIDHLENVGLLDYVNFPNAGPVHYILKKITFVNVTTGIIGNFFTYWDVGKLQWKTHFSNFQFFLRDWILSLVRNIFSFPWSDGLIPFIFRKIFARHTILNTCSLFSVISVIVVHGRVQFIPHYRNTFPGENLPTPVCSRSVLCVLPISSFKIS